jgi:hypothetical protein
MVLDYLGITVDYHYLTRLLKTTETGTYFPNITQLTSLGMFVHIGKHAELSIYERNLGIGLPVIAAVTTFGWQHWQGEITRHAVVVTGIDPIHELIYIHDPFFATAPIEMPLVEFETGWEEQERQYAVIGLAPL